MKVLILGASGMVGSEVLKFCIENEEISRIITIERRVNSIKHPKLQCILHKDFLDFSHLRETFKGIDICYYCLGVYQNKVSKKEFWEITVDYFSALLKEIKSVNKSVVFCLFSAQGASLKERSLFRFGNAKGRAEALLLRSELKKKYIFRPGYINPNSKENKTCVSRIFQGIYKLFPFIGIDVCDLAKVMVVLSLKGHNKCILENSEIRRLA